jgi:hypothetical protein
MIRLIGIFVVLEVGVGVIVGRALRYLGRHDGQMIDQDRDRSPSHVHSTFAQASRVLELRPIR